MTTVVSKTFDFGERPIGPLAQLLTEREVIGAKMDAALETLAGSYSEVCGLHREIARQLTGHARQNQPDFLTHEKIVAVLKARIAAAFAPVSPGGPHNSPFGLASDRTPLVEVFRKQHEHLVVKGA